MPPSSVSNIVARLVSHPRRKSAGRAANDLLEHFRSGYPLNDLQLLLRSDDPDVLEIAVWIASELGEMFRPLISLVSPLLHHQEPKIRYFALECVLAADSDQSCIFAQSFQLLSDPDDRIREKAMRVLSLLSREQILSSLRCGHHRALASSYSSQVMTLSDSEKIPPGEISALLSDSDRFVRRIGAAAAVRVRKRDDGPFKIALESSDSEISRFARAVAEELL
jgi:hypothetical protein